MKSYNRRKWNRRSSILYCLGSRLAEGPRVERADRHSSIINNRWYRSVRRGTTVCCYPGYPSFVVIAAQRKQKSVPCCAVRMSDEAKIKEKKQRQKQDNMEIEKDVEEGKEGIEEETEDDEEKENI
ncbi:uncharacterized protein LOC143893579 [Temnothorax americanus]|uniref:uncharacterized protein LOC143893579 n=1 Tax=Temnothorax americanus TaxID=1964332 RepID=UPI004068BF69